MAAAFSLPSVVMAQAAPAAAEASPHTFTGNVALVTDYRFRGISQTYGLPAIQGGADYAHASGLYLGTWGSNVYSTAGNGIGTSYTNGASLEWDMYGGYKFEAAKDLTLDVGALYYYYPGANWNVAGRDKFDNLELYVAATYKWFSAKYSQSLTDYFGANTSTLGGACGIQTDGKTATTNCFGAAPGSWRRRVTAKCKWAADQESFFPRRDRVVCQKSKTKTSRSQKHRRRKRSSSRR